MKKELYETSTRAELNISHALNFNINRLSLTENRKTNRLIQPRNWIPEIQNESELNNYIPSFF